MVSIIIMIVAIAVAAIAGEWLPFDHSDGCDHKVTRGFTLLSHKQGTYEIIYLVVITEMLIFRTTLHL